MIGRRNGFSLLEVLIALTLVAIGFAAAMKLFPMALRQAQVAQERSVVCELAETKFAQLRAAGGRNLLHNWQYMAPLFQWSGSDPARLDEASGLYESYSTTIQRLVGAADIYAHQVTFVVRMHDGREERFVTIISEI